MPKNSHSVPSRREAVRAALLEASVREAVADPDSYAEIQRTCGEDESFPGEIEFAKDVLREADRRLRSSTRDHDRAPRRSPRAPQERPTLYA